MMTFDRFRSCRSAVALLGVLLAATLVSYLSAAISVGVCALVLAVCAIASDTMIVLLALFLIPYAQLFNLDSRDMFVVTGVALVMLAVSVVWHQGWRRHWREFRSLYGLVLSLFVLLVLMHLTAFSRQSVEGALFLLVLMLTFSVSKGLAADGSGAGRFIPLAMVASGAVAGVLSALFTFSPLPWLVADHPSIDNMRLAGLFDGPNAAGRFLLPSFIFFYVSACRSGKAVTWTSALVLCAILIVATGSKTAMIAAIVGAGVVIFLNPQRGVRALGLLLFTMSCMAMWLFFVQPWVEHRAAERWVALGQTNVSYVAAVPPSEVDVIKRDLRFGVSSRMTEEDGRIEYRNRPYSILNTGQRTLLWSAGWRAFSTHPFWGIGYKNWRSFMMEALRFPFVSPHNGFLEVAGEYGILGAALYMALCMCFAARLIKVRSTFQRQERSGLLWATGSAAGMLAFEITDVNASLAVTLASIWFWTFLAVQEGLLASDEPGPNSRGQLKACITRGSFRRDDHSSCSASSDTGAGRILSASCGGLRTTPAGWSS